MQASGIAGALSGRVHDIAVLSQVGGNVLDFSMDTAMDDGEVMTCEKLTRY